MFRKFHRNVKEIPSQCLGNLCLLHWFGWPLPGRRLDPFPDAIDGDEGQFYASLKQPSLPHILCSVVHKKEITRLPLFCVFEK